MDNSFSADSDNKKTEMTTCEDCGCDTRVTYSVEWRCGVITKKTRNRIQRCDECLDYALYPPSQVTRG
jgi:hypothetical protein